MNTATTDRIARRSRPWRNLATGPTPLSPEALQGECTTPASAPPPVSSHQGFLPKGIDAEWSASQLARTTTRPRHQKPSIIPVPPFHHPYRQVLPHNRLPIQAAQRHPLVFTMKNYSDREDSTNSLHFPARAYEYITRYRQGACTSRSFACTSSLLSEKRLQRTCRGTMHQMPWIRTNLRQDRSRHQAVAGEHSGHGTAWCGN